MKERETFISRNIQCSVIHPIDGTIVEGSSAKPFYIQTDVDKEIKCAVYMCYLSQLDENYTPSNQSLQIRAGLTVKKN
jgi:hypothetical protein